MKLWVSCTIAPVLRLGTYPFPELGVCGKNTMPYASIVVFYRDVTVHYQYLGYRARISEQQAQSSFILGVWSTVDCTSQKVFCRGRKPGAYNPRVSFILGYPLVVVVPY